MSDADKPKPTWINVDDGATAVMRVPGGMLVQTTVMDMTATHMGTALAFVPCSPSEFLAFVRGKYEEQARSLMASKPPDRI